MMLPFIYRNTQRHNTFSSFLLFSKKKKKSKLFHLLLINKNSMVTTICVRTNAPKKKTEISHPIKWCGLLEKTLIWPEQPAQWLRPYPVTFAVIQRMFHSVQDKS